MAIGGSAGAILLWPLFYLVVTVSWVALAAFAGARTASDWLQACLSRPAEFGLWVLFGLWALMVLAMMLPTSIPFLTAYSNILSARPGQDWIGRFWAFLAGYVLVWLGFALVMALAQHLSAPADFPPAGNSLPAGFLAAFLLGLAGLYQFSGLKHACLARCRQPMTFFLAHWRDGRPGALRMGLRHGLDCLGCCWALMALSFIGGAMNLALMALGMGLMLVEKLAGPGRLVTYPLGFALLGGAGIAAGWALVPSF
jgi:predicted metal-binding membrane protein